jgi:aspartate racemase
MKTAGIVGGIGPESTIEYYRSIVRLYRERNPDGSYPRIVINSIDAGRMLGLFGGNQPAEATAFLSGEVERLARAGADFGVVAANTPHLVFDDLRARATIPLISIVEATCEEAKARGFRRLGLLGTRYTMGARFYPDGLLRAGIEMALPSSEDQDYVHEKYMGELVNGVIRPETKEGLLAVVDRLKAREGIDGAILGGTELSLILRDQDTAAVPLLDTTRIHVEAIVTRMLS